MDDGTMYSQLSSCRSFILVVDLLVVIAPFLVDLSLLVSFAVMLSNPLPSGIQDQPSPEERTYHSLVPALIEVCDLSLNVLRHLTHIRLSKRARSLSGMASLASLQTELSYLNVIFISHHQ